MPEKVKHDIVNRWEGNPIIDLESLSFSCTNMYNAGAVKIGNEYILLVTIESLEGKSFICLARSDDGLHFTVDEKIFMNSQENNEFEVYEKRGIIDARITRLDNKYYITYLGVGRHGIVLCLASTVDFRKVERLGIISEPETKAGALFPAKFKGRYARLERPRQSGSIWISYSKDLFTWGEMEVVLGPRRGFWDTDRVGCAVPPILIDEGWLLIYYSVKNTSAGPITRIGAAVLDKKNPSKMVSRSNIPILSPREDYERIGDINNLVFSTGAVLEDDGELKIYYGVADNCICLGTTKLNDVINCCNESMKDY